MEHIKNMLNMLTNEMLRPGLAESCLLLSRFAKDTNAVAVPWAESLTCDEEMIVEDLWGSIAHVTMLGVPLLCRFPE